MVGRQTKKDHGHSEGADSDEAIEGRMVGDRRRESRGEHGEKERPHHSGAAAISGAEEVASDAGWQTLARFSPGLALVVESGSWPLQLPV